MRVRACGDSMARRDCGFDAGPDAPVLRAPGTRPAVASGRCGSQRFGTAAVQHQPRRGAEHALRARPGCVRSTPSAAPSQPEASASSVSAANSRVVAAALRQLRRALVQRFAHQRRRWCDAAAEVAAIARRSGRWSARCRRRTTSTGSRKRACTASNARKRSTPSLCGLRIGDAHAGEARAACARARCAGSARSVPRAGRRAGSRWRRWPDRRRRSAAAMHRQARRRRSASRCGNAMHLAGATVACSGAHLSRVLPRSNSHALMPRPPVRTLTSPAWNALLAAIVQAHAQGAVVGHAQSACRSVAVRRACSVTALPGQRVERGVARQERRQAFGDRSRPARATGAAARAATIVLRSAAAARVAARPARSHQGWSISAAVAAGIRTLRPSPITARAGPACSPPPSTSSPPSLRRPARSLTTTRSLGHFSRASLKPRPCSASAAATPATRLSPPSRARPPPKLRATDRYRCAASGDAQTRPRRPRPPVWRSASRISAPAARAHGGAAVRCWSNRSSRRLPEPPACVRTGGGKAARMAAASSRSSGCARA